jgi:hypothetical protein
MKKTIIAALTALFLLNIMAGCAPTEEEAPQAAEPEQTEISADLEGINDIDSELNISELESLEQELAELEELFS